jgi:hypothetical protein
MTCRPHYPDGLAADFQLTTDCSRATMQGSGWIYPDGLIMIFNLFTKTMATGKAAHCQD